MYEISFLFIPLNYSSSWKLRCTCPLWEFVFFKPLWHLFCYSHIVFNEGENKDVDYSFRFRLQEGELSSQHAPTHNTTIRLCRIIRMKRFSSSKATSRNVPSFVGKTDTSIYTVLTLGIRPQMKAACAARRHLCFSLTQTRQKRANVRCRVSLSVFIFVCHNTSLLNTSELIPASVTVTKGRVSSDKHPRVCLLCQNGWFCF